MKESMSEVRSYRRVCDDGSLILHRVRKAATMQVCGRSAFRFRAPSSPSGAVYADVGQDHRLFRFVGNWLFPGGVTDPDAGTAPGTGRQRKVETGKFSVWPAAL